MKELGTFAQCAFIGKFSCECIQRGSLSLEKHSKGHIIPLEVEGFGLNFLKARFLAQDSHGTQLILDEVPNNVFCTMGKWTSGESSCLGLFTVLILWIPQVHIRNQPDMQAICTCE
jgi:hypothetical protein